MGFYVVITNNEEKPFEFVTVNGVIKEYHSTTDVLSTYKRTIEEHGSDNVMLLESINVRVKMEVDMPQR